MTMLGDIIDGAALGSGYANGNIGVSAYGPAGSYGSAQAAGYENGVPSTVVSPESDSGVLVASCYGWVNNPYPETQEAVEKKDKSLLWGTVIAVIGILWLISGSGSGGAK